MFMHEIATDKLKSLTPVHENTRATFRWQYTGNDIIMRDYRGNTMDIPVIVELRLQTDGIFMDFPSYHKTVHADGRTSLDNCYTTYKKGNALKTITLSARYNLNDLSFDRSLGRYYPNEKFYLTAASDLTTNQYNALVGIFKPLWNAVLNADNLDQLMTMVFINSHLQYTERINKIVAVATEFAQRNVTDHYDAPETLYLDGFLRSLYNVRKNRDVYFNLSYWKRVDRDSKGA